MTKRIMSTLLQRYTQALPHVSTKKITALLTNASAKASTVAALPIPVVNVAGVVYVQVNMIHDLADEFGVEQDDSYTNVIVSSIVTTLLSELASEAISSMPVASKIESAIGESIIRASLAGFITNITGYVFTKHLSEGGNINNIGIDAFIDFVKEYMHSDEMSFSKLSNNLVGTVLHKAGVDL